MGNTGRYHSFIFFLFGCLAFAPPVRADSPAITISPKDLAKATTERIDRVAEFNFIRKEAERLGLRAWLFGGTAASYAHYVKWDLRREGGDAKYQKERFDYDYTNIYRSNQDLDIVVDGPADKAAELEKILELRFPHLQGDKSAWEIRLLREERNNKQPLLNNPDFLNQHTDSNSTGLVELTRPQNGEPAIRDLFEWNTKQPTFLKDIAEDKVTYRFSPKHEETEFFKRGRNPPIFSVIRFLIKAFQFELEIRPQDLEQIRKIIQAWDPKSLGDGYPRDWVEKNAKKLFTSAVDIEYAWNTLEALGLRKKLAATSKLKGEEETSLKTLMEREPLRSEPLGRGRGKTAKSLGIDVISHETSDFGAYESITMSRKGIPNFFISRAGSTGEAAAFGDGLYTMIGNKGAKGTGYTIRMRLNPNARVDTDFKIVNDSYVLVLNRNAVEVIPEDLQLNPVDWFGILKSMNDEDRGTYEKLRRRIQHRLRNLTETEDRQISEMIRATLNGKGKANKFLADEIIEIYPHLKTLKLSLTDTLWLLAKTDKQIGDFAQIRAMEAHLNAVQTDPAEIKNLLQWIHQEVLRSKENKGLVIAYAKLPISATHFEVQPWFDMLAADKGFNSWETEAFEALRSRLNQHIAKMTKREKEKLGKFVATQLMRGHQNSTYAILRMWLRLDAAEEVIPISEWLKIIATRNKIAEYYGFDEELSGILNRRLLNSTPEEKRDAVATATAIVKKGRPITLFNKIWNGLTLSTEHPEVLQERVNSKNFNVNEIEALGHAETPQPELWQEAIRVLKGAQLSKFARAFFSNGGYGKPLPHSEAKAALLPYLVDRLIEEKQTKYLSSFPYIFREPHATQWQDQLDQTIEKIAKTNNAQLMKEFGNYLFIQTGGGVSQWGSSLNKFTRALAATKNKEMFLGFVSRINFRRFRMDGIEDPLLVAIENASQLGDLKSLESLARQIGTKESEDSAAKMDPRQTTALDLVASRKSIDSAIALKDISILEDFASHTTTKGLESVFEELIQLAVKRKSKTLFSGLGRAFRAEEHRRDPRLHEFIASAAKANMQEPLYWLAQSTFYGYEVEDVGRVEDLKFLINTLFEMKAAKELETVGHWSLILGSDDVRKYYAEAHKLFVDRLVAAKKEPWAKPVIEKYLKDAESEFRKSPLMQSSIKRLSEKSCGTAHEKVAGRRKAKT